MWAQTDSNRRPPACKAGALNQLSYAPLNPLADGLRISPKDFPRPLRKSSAKDFRNPYCALGLQRTGMQRYNKKSFQQTFQQ